MRIARWIPKATDTHSEYLILIALPWQQWLRERASVLRYTYNACLANSQFCGKKMVRSSMEERTVPSDTINTLCNIYLHIVLMKTNRFKCCGVMADTKQQASRSLCQ